MKQLQSHLYKMKRLILWLALLLPFFANAQVNGTIQKTSSTGTIRGNFGSSGLDTLPRVTGALVNGYILKYHAATNKWYASPDPTYPGLQDSLTKKANRTFDNVASGAIANVKLANSTISGVSLGSNLNTLTLGNGLIGTSYNGSSAVTARVDTTTIQTVSNFFPKGDTRYYRLSNPQLNGTGIVEMAGTTPSYLSTTGTGSVVKATSPTLVTPDIGSATGTFLGLGASSPLYSEQLLLSGSTPKIALGSAGGYRWTTRIIPANGEWALRYEEGSLDVLTINRNGNAAFNNFAGVGGVTSPLYSEQFSVSGSTPKIMLGSSDGYRWSSRIIPSSGKLAFRYEEGALDAMVIDRLGVVSVPALRIPTGANTGYILTSDSDGDASWQSPTSGMTYKGAWDASTNTPTLADGVGTTGDTYSVSVGGTQFGRSFVAGGQAIYNGTIWQNIGTSSAVTSVNTYTGAVTLTKSDIGLSNVDNTSDLNKPVSTATQTALDLKANIASPTFTGTVTIPSGASLGTPASMVGTNITGTATGLTVGNSDKWANLNYTGTNAAVTGYVMAYQGGNDFGIADVSYLRTFLGLGSNAYTSTSYAPLNSPTFTGTPSMPTGTTGVTQTQGDNSNKLATTAYVDALGGTILGAQKQIATTYTNISTSGTSEQSLFNHNIAQSNLSSDGDRIDFNFTGSFGLNANDKYVRISVGGNLIPISGNASNKSVWEFEGYLMRTSSTTFRIFIKSGVDYVYTSTVLDKVVTDFNPLNFQILGQTNNASFPVTVQIGYLQSKKAP